jgi:hypothetical protein
MKLAGEYSRILMSLEDNVPVWISQVRVPIYRDGIVASPAANISHGTITVTGKDRRFR